MKQILQSYRTGELWLAEVPAPACLPNGIKVLVHSSLVSAGTEKQMINLAKSSLLQKALKRPDQVRRVIQKIKAEGLMSTWEQVSAKLDAPVPLGYSAAGVVVETGAQAGEFRVGQRVACAGAGYASHAEVITVPKTLAVPLPEGLEFEQAAFGTVGAIAMQAVRQSQTQVGELVGVVGLGLLGNLVTQILVAAGVRVVGTDLNPSRCSLAIECGAEACGTDLKALADQVTGGRDLDAVIIAASASDSSILQACPAALRHRGSVVVLGFVGMECPHQEFYKKELQLRMSMSYGPGRYDPAYEEQALDYPYPFVRWTEQRNLDSFLHLVVRGRVSTQKLITHRFEFDRALEAYQLIESKQPYLGIVLQYPARQESLQQFIHRRPARTSVSAPLGHVALVGAGGFSVGTLSPLLKKLGVPVHVVVAQRGATTEAVAQKLEAKLSATDVAVALEDPKVTHVIIATRHENHAAQAEAALKAGKRVHVEKPLCLTREQLSSLNQLVSKLGAQDRIFVGFNRRYSPLTQLLFSELRASPADPVALSMRVNAGFVEEGHWFFNDPGGRLVAEGCHFIDLCLFLIGKPLVRVDCVQQGGRGRPFDSFTVVLGFENGSLASIIYSGQGDRALPKERIEVFQAKTCWVNEDWSSLTRFHQGKIARLYSGKQQKGWREELEHFLGIRSLPMLAPSWEDIVCTHQALFDAVDSALGVKSAVSLGKEGT